MKTLSFYRKVFILCELLLLFAVNENLYCQNSKIYNFVLAEIYDTHNHKHFKYEKINIDTAKMLIYLYQGANYVFCEAFIHYDSISNGFSIDNLDELFVFKTDTIYDIDNYYYFDIDGDSQLEMLHLFASYEPYQEVFQSLYIEEHIFEIYEKFGDKWIIIDFKDINVDS